MDFTAFVVVIQQQQRAMDYFMNKTLISIGKFSRVFLLSQNFANHLDLFKQMSAEEHLKLS